MSRAVILLLSLAGCATTTAPRTVFSIEGAAPILRAGSDADRREIEAKVARLSAEFGYAPSGDHRELRELRDLLDREELWSRLFEEPALSLGREDVRTLGYGFRPTDATRLIRGATGPPAAALADPAIRGLFDRLRGADLLHDEAGRDLLRVDGDRLAALRSLATRPDALDRVRRFERMFGSRFRPTDAAALLDESTLALTEAQVAFAREVLDALAVEMRPLYMPELRTLVDRPDRTRDLFALAREGEVRLSGKGSLLVLARLAAHPPPTGPERERFRELARRCAWPDAADFVYLVPLARVPGSVETIDALADRYPYRFRASDAKAIERLTARGVPDPPLPDWIRDDRAPLVRPGRLDSDEPAAAFADPNDLRFMESLDRTRPDLARRPRRALESEVRARLRRMPIRHRMGAPYPEDADDLRGFLRPDLLKAILLLDALSRPEVVATIYRWMREDIADRTSEAGGYVRLDGEGRLAFTRYEAPGGAGRNDRVLLPPDPAGAALEFHFHATDEDDAHYAGPSSGAPGTDLFRAKVQGTDGVVFTKVEGPRFDADLYLSSKFVLDLGVRSVDSALIFP